MVIFLVPKENDQLTMGTSQASRVKSHHQQWLFSVKIQLLVMWALDTKQWPKVVQGAQLQSQLRMFGFFEVFHYSAASFMSLVKSSLGAERWVVINRVGREWLWCVCVYIHIFVNTHLNTFSNIHVRVCIHVATILLAHSPKFRIRKVLW